MFFFPVYCRAQGVPHRRDLPDQPQCFAAAHRHGGSRQHSREAVRAQAVSLCDALCAALCATATVTATAAVAIGAEHQQHD
jgi:hypothetical protein